MGAAQSPRMLSQEERIRERTGDLYSTIEDVWEFSHEEEYTGSYSDALTLRREKTLDYYRAALRLREGDDSILHQYDDIITVMSEHSSIEEIEVSSVSSVGANSIKGHVYPRTRDERRVEKKTTSLTGGRNKGRAHIIPEDDVCRGHCEVLMDVLSGYVFDSGSGIQRKTMANSIMPLSVNKIILNGNHQGIFDNLSQGKLVIIPLLDQDKITRWTPREPYKVLVVCDIPYAYTLFSQTTEQDSAGWATPEQLECATTVLRENTLILADSLDKNWDHHEKQPHDHRYRQLLKLRNILIRDKRVRIPHTVDVAGLKLNPWSPFDGRLKLLVIDLGMLYPGDLAAYIPDPWPLAFKSCSNMSACAYSTPTTGILKLMAACGGGDDEASDTVDKFERSTLEFTRHGDGTSGSDSVSSLGEEDMLLPLELTSCGAEKGALHLPVVSDDDSSNY